MTSNSAKSTGRNPQRMARMPEQTEPAGEGAYVSDPGAPKRITKQALVLDLLRRDGGVALVQIVEATGWQAHTARAALTGLKKKGHAVQSTKVDKITRYSLA